MTDLAHLLQSIAPSFLFQACFYSTSPARALLTIKPARAAVEFAITSNIRFKFDHFILRTISKGYQGAHLSDIDVAHRSKRVQLIPRVNFSILCFGHSLDLAELGNEHISCKRGDWAAQWPLKGVLFSPTLKIRKKSVF